jgi:hypothetical protein
MPVPRYRSPRGALWPIPAAILLALVALAAEAQPTATPEPPADPPRAEEDIVEASAEERRPLEDYEASEQISEDLSVSFPVDI